MGRGKSLLAIVVSLALCACDVVPTGMPSGEPILASAVDSASSSRPAQTEPASGGRDADTAPAEPPSPQDIRPLGFAGRGGPAQAPVDDFYTTPDRWRVGIPGNYIQNTRNDTLFDPYAQNVLKGDYAVPGTQNQFLIVMLTSDTLTEARRTPIPSGVSARAPGAFSFFGNGESQLVQQNFVISADYFIGDAAYRPRDFEVRGTGVFNANYVHLDELGLVNPDVRQGRDRTDYALAPQEAFVEKKLADLSPNFDFVSVRAGIQGFNNDFRGFLFADDEPGVRFFGNYDNNHIQYNAAWFHQLEKDTNSGLNTPESRDQNVILANVFRQDFLTPGYTAQFSLAGNLDHSGGKYDTNGVLVRPAPIGTIHDKSVEAFYFGWAGDGHIGRINLTHQFYQAFGRESYNPIAGRSVWIDAQFFAVELSYDMDYIRYHASFVYSSGDHDPQNGAARGFDTIFDNPNFAGGGFSYFVRQSIPLTGSGVNLVNRNSLVPDLRSSKEQGQANFVNPGLFLYNVGMDVDVTPELTFSGNASYLRFDSTAPLQLVLQDNKISKEIGVDLSIGLRFRPLLNNNLILTAGGAMLIPSAGFGDLYSSQALYSAFLSMTITY